VGFTFCEQLRGLAMGNLPNASSLGSPAIHLPTIIS